MVQEKGLNEHAFYAWFLLPFLSAIVTAIAIGGEKDGIWQGLYLLPFFTGIAGALVAWFVNKDRDRRRAVGFLKWGMVFSMIVLVIVLVVWCPECLPDM